MARKGTQGWFCWWTSRSIPRHVHQKPPTGACQMLKSDISRKTSCPKPSSSGTRPVGSLSSAASVSTSIFCFPGQPARSACRCELSMSEIYSQTPNAPLSIAVRDLLPGSPSVARVEFPIRALLASIQASLEDCRQLKANQLASEKLRSVNV
ncbi:hypothetical protein VTN77DRAFT_8901 [Rasamsonia byssochlamydoides]|uniref:uncharacterized protein n=1 Tax=Rasamsonia byssochlamydoides TaxID=89139 RepID=UPI003742DD5E